MLNHEILMDRVNSDDELRVFEQYDVKTIMQHFLDDPVLGDLTREVNYPFAVIREAMKEHSDDVHRILREIRTKSEQ